MSYLITVKVPGDTAAFTKALDEHGDEFVAISERAKTVGATHHRFGVGEGFILVVDEWDSPQQFEAFFGDAALQAFIGGVGGDTSSPPDITVTEAIASPDQF